MKQLHRLVIPFIFLASFLSALSTSAAEKPNVLFIAVDDLNDWIGCMKGHPQALTPNIDRLADRGMLFTNAHCAAPACNPSRAAVFSGKMPGTTGVWSNDSARLTKLQPNLERLPTSFAKAGYRTLGTGKLSGDKSPFEEYHDVDQRWSPLTRKSVRYTAEELPTKGTQNPRHAVDDSRGRQIILPLNRMPSDRKPDTDDGESFDWGPWNIPDSDFAETQITDWAIDKISEADDQPFFLGVGYYRPHIPLWAPKRFFERFADAPGKLPPLMNDDLNDLSKTAKKWAIQPVTAGSHATVVEHDQWQAAIEAYLACVTYVDHEIGRLLDALESSSKNDNTVIVLWSDHGWHLGEKQHWGKWTGWERSTRVPLIIALPRTDGDRYADPGSRCDQPVSLIDLYPTLTQLCNVTAPKQLAGQSLVRLLCNPEMETGRPVVTIFDEGNISARTKQWRYIQYADRSDELYDHFADPNEWHNLADSEKHATIKESLKEIVQRMHH